MDLPLLEKPIPPILMYCDNQSMLAQVMNAKDNFKSNKHIKRSLKIVRKMRNSGVIAVSLLSVKTHRRVVTGNTKSREVAGVLVGTAPSVNGPESGTCLCFKGRGACHLIYT